MSIWDTPTTDTLLDDRQKADEVVFVGQQHIKDQVEPLLKSERFPHVLLTGDPGLGKTHFARWLAWRRQKPFYERLAPVKASELPVYGVLLLDEVHRQSNVEALFPMMDEGLLTTIAATTKPDKLDSAFKSRFLISLKLRKYSLAEMEEIILHMADHSKRWDGVDVLANASNGHPRTAERIVTTAQALGTWEPAVVLKACRITADGLTADHMDFLAALDEIGRPVGVGQVQSTAGLSEDSLRRVEKDLVSKRLVELSPSGRKLTLRGGQYVEMLRDEGAI